MAQSRADESVSAGVTARRAEAEQRAAHALAAADRELMTERLRRETAESELATLQRDAEENDTEHLRAAVAGLREELAASQAAVRVRERALEEHIKASQVPCNPSAAMQPTAWWPCPIADSVRAARCSPSKPRRWPRHGGRRRRRPGRCRRRSCWSGPPRQRAASCLVHRPVVVGGASRSLLARHSQVRLAGQDEMETELEELRLWRDDQARLAIDLRQELMAEQGARKKAELVSAELVTLVTTQHAGVFDRAGDSRAPQPPQPQPARCGPPQKLAVARPNNQGKRDYDRPWLAGGQPQPQPQREQQRMPMAPEHAAGGWATAVVEPDILVRQPPCPDHVLIAITIGRLHRSGRPSELLSFSMPFVNLPLPFRCL